jgi:hypothetical protein
VPLAHAVDQKALVAILRKRAAADGHLHVGNVSRRWRDFQARSGTSSPDQRGALFVGFGETRTIASPKLTLETTAIRAEHGSHSPAAKTRCAARFLGTAFSTTVGRDGPPPSRSP